MDDPRHQAEWALARLLTDDLAVLRTRVIEWGPYYLQWERDLPGTLVVELTSNRFLDQDDRLQPADEQTLGAAGFDAPTPGRPNWTTWVADTGEAIHVARSAVRALTAAYHLPAEAVLQAVLDVTSGSRADHAKGDVVDAGTKQQHDRSSAPAPVVPLRTGAQSRYLESLRAGARNTGPGPWQTLVQYADGTLPWQAAVVEIANAAVGVASTLNALDTAVSAGVLTAEQSMQAKAAAYVQRLADRPGDGVSTTSVDAVAEVITKHASGTVDWDTTLAGLAGIDWSAGGRVALQEAAPWELFTTAELRALDSRIVVPGLDPPPAGYDVVGFDAWPRHPWLCLLNKTSDIDGTASAWVIGDRVPLPDSDRRTLAKMRIQHRALLGDWQDASSAAGDHFYWGTADFGGWIPDEAGPLQWRVLIPTDLVLPAIPADPAPTPPTDPARQGIPQTANAHVADSSRSDSTGQEFLHYLTELDEHDGPALREQLDAWLAQSVLDDDWLPLTHDALCGLWQTAGPLRETADPVVRLALAHNPHADAGTLRVLADDPDPHVRDAAHQRLTRRSGCSACRGSKQRLNPIGGELSGRAFARHQPTEAGHRTSYQNDRLSRCLVCGGLWLDQFWEVDTPETSLEEWGVTHRRWIALSHQDAETIERALETGELLTHDQFVSP